MALNEREAIFTRFLDDGRVIDVMPLLGGRARIIVSPDALMLSWTDGW